jgi:hypothetical protein
MSRLGMLIVVVTAIVLAWSVAMWVHGAFVKPAPAHVEWCPLNGASCRNIIATVEPENESWTSGWTFVTELPVPKSKGPCVVMHSLANPLVGGAMDLIEPGPVGYKATGDRKCKSGLRWVRP